MTKQELLSALAEKTGETKKSIDTILNALGEITKEQLVQGNEIPLPNIGKLKPQKTASRNGRNPRTGETLIIPASTKVAFKVSKELADAVKGK